MAAPTECEFVSEAIVEDKLIDIWPDYPCLYNVRCSDFKNRDRREKAVQEIACKLNQSEEWVKAKIKALRNSYTKAKKPQSSGSARKSVTKRTAWLLEKLQFLAPYIASRISISNLDSPPDTATASDDSFNLEDDVEESVTPQPFTEPEPIIKRSTKQPLREKPKSTKKKQAEEELKLIKSLTTSIAERGSKRQRNEEDVSSVELFGRYVTKSLSELEPQVRHLAEHEINDILFKARMGTLGFSNQMQHQNQPNNWPPPEYRLDQSQDQYHLTQL